MLSKKYPRILGMIVFLKFYFIEIIKVLGISVWYPRNIQEFLVWLYFKILFHRNKKSIEDNLKVLGISVWYPRNIQEFLVWLYI